MKKIEVDCMAELLPPRPGWGVSYPEFIGLIVKVLSGPHYPDQFGASWKCDTPSGGILCHEAMLRRIDDDSDQFDSRAHWDDWMKPAPGELIIFEPLDVPAPEEVEKVK